MAHNFEELDTVKLFNIHDQLKSDTTTIEFCQRYSLLKQTPYCQMHGTQYILHKYKNTYNWTCNRKGHLRRPHISIREGSIFHGFHLSIDTIIRFLYCWSYELFNHSDFLRELDLSDKTVVNWKNFLRDICAQHFLQNPPIIGGLGHIVEIDESLNSQKI